MICEAWLKSGRSCTKTATFLVNGGISEIQSATCSVHLPSMVKELETYTAPMVKRRNHGDKYANTVFVLKH